MSEADRLNAQYGLKDMLFFDAGPGGLTRATITSDTATAEVYLQGAHVAHWQPAGAEHPVLFLSERDPLRGRQGDPRWSAVWCFHGLRSARAGCRGGMHGFARTLPWEVAATELRPEGVALSFKLLPNQTTRDVGFDHFVLIYEVVVGATLSLTLEVENVGDSPLTLEEALHAYYSVSDVRQVEVSGLSDTDYLDRADNAKRKHQGAGAIRFAGETDQLPPEYASYGYDLRSGLEAAHRDREAWVEEHGGWNPWIEKARAMADFGDDEWPGMVCVEPANAAEDAVTVAPGTVHSMGITVRVEGA